MIAVSTFELLVLDIGLGLMLCLSRVQLCELIGSKLLDKRVGPASRVSMRQPCNLGGFKVKDSGVWPKWGKVHR